MEVAHSLRIGRRMCRRCRFAIAGAIVTFVNLFDCEELILSILFLGVFVFFQMIWTESRKTVIMKKFAEHMAKTYTQNTKFLVTTNAHLWAMFGPNI
jgi:hypothetical protein